MLDNVDCPAAPVFLSTRRNVPVPISSAATRNLYNYLYGFVEAAELFVFVKFSKSAPSKNANDILTPTICLNMNTLSNVPTEYGTLIVFGDYNHAVQLYTAAATTNAIYIRQRTSTVWSTWTNLL